MSENQSLKVLDFDTLMCFVQGLIQVAKVDGIQPKEQEYIEGFLREELTYLEHKDEFVFDDLIKQSFDINKLSELIQDNDLKEYFLKSCVMLACVDTFSPEEKELINEFSNKLNYSTENLNTLINQVQTEIMEHFKDISIYQDSLREVAKSIGVEDF